MTRLALSLITISSAFVCAAFFRPGPANAQETSAVVSAAAAPTATTAIDQYVRKQDPSYRWQVVRSDHDSEIQTVVIDMVSQSWRSSNEVDRTEWQHWMTCAVPKNLRSDTAFLMIGGGSNRGSAPDAPSKMVMQIAQATGSVACELRMVPNQPLEFHQDGQARTEDDLIGYTWDRFLDTGEPGWLARGPMVKSAVRAMDTITAMMASETGEGRKVDKFVVAGASKRGWTTWLTGAMDDRVLAIVPIVIDVLNADVSMRHHFAAYGYWAPSVGDYVRHRIMERISHPRLKEAYQLVDPYSYRHRLTLPKFILNAAGDEFFLPDSSQFYFDQLKGPKYLRYVPNAGHGLDDTDAFESVLAFYGLILAGKKPPEFAWTVQPDGSFRITSKQEPAQVRLWSATNPKRRDFRVETMGHLYTSASVKSADGKTFVAGVTKPEQGWTAYFVELTYDVGMPTPLKVTTNVRVVPDVLPYADRSPIEPFSLTLVCNAGSNQHAMETVARIKALVGSGKFPARDLKTRTDGPKCYFNWIPELSESEREAMKLATLLKDLKCTQISFQLESGREITP